MTSARVGLNSPLLTDISWMLDRIGSDLDYIRREMPELGHYLQRAHGDVDGAKHTVALRLGEAQQRGE